jgi:hypothetical protein
MLNRPENSEIRQIIGRLASGYIVVLVVTMSRLRGRTGAFDNVDRRWCSPSTFCYCTCSSSGAGSDTLKRHPADVLEKNGNNAVVQAL